MATSVHESLDVQHDEAARQYVLRYSGERVGALNYHRSDDLVDIFHTEISPQLRGKGLGAVLVRDALEDLRDSECRVRASCWYVRDFLRDHDEFADLVEERPRS